MYQLQKIETNKGVTNTYKNNRSQSAFIRAITWDLNTLENKVNPHVCYTNAFCDKKINKSIRRKQK